MQAAKLDRLYSIDYLKGILILLVFVGHIIPGVLRDTYPRYAIYSFHMPLFIGISGFLFKIEVIEIRLISLFQKYWKRFILPWIIGVFLFWIALGLISDSTLSLKSFVLAFVYPYYHLWYVLGIISYISIMCIMWKIFKTAKYRWVHIIILSLFISVISKWDIISKVVTNETVLKGVSLIQYDFRLYNLVFFAIGVFLGYLYRDNRMDSNIVFKYPLIECCRVLLAISIAIVAILFFFNNGHLENIMFFIMNAALLIVLIDDSVKFVLPHSSFVEFLGKYTLPIYLYHVFCKLFALKCFTEGSAGYYCVSILTFSLGCVLVYFLRNSNIAKRFLFGNG